MVDERKVPEGYKVTEVGVIPENWDVKKLGEIGEPIIGLTYKPENIVPYGMLVLRSSNIDNNRIDLADNVYVDVEVRDRLIVEENDLLICVRNGSRRLIGKCALISKEVAGVTFGAFMSLYKSDFSRYIFQYFQTNSIKKQIEENMGATINQITNKSLSNFVIAIPQNHNEQESIIEALTDTDNLIQSVEKLINKKKKIKQGAMQQLLTGKKRLPGFSGEWEEFQLVELLDYEQPTAYIVKSTDYSVNGIPVLTPGKSFVLGYTNETLGIFSEVPVIIFDDFTTVSKFVTFPFKVKSSAMKMLKLRNKAHNLRLIFEIMQILKFTIGDHKRYWISEYSRLKINLPSIEEQKAIAQVLSDMDAEIKALEEKLEKYKTIKQGMMQELLTGRIRLI